MAPTQRCIHLHMEISAKTRLGRVATAEALPGAASVRFSLREHAGHGHIEEYSRGKTE